MQLRGLCRLRLPLSLPSVFCSRLLPGVLPTSGPESANISGPLDLPLTLLQLPIPPQYAGPHPYWQCESCHRRSLEDLTVALRRFLSQELSLQVQGKPRPAQDWNG